VGQSASSVNSIRLLVRAWCSSRSVLESGPSLTRRVSGGPEVAAGVSTFCFGYAAGELVVDPLLHDVAPSVFAE
jgi:hypothetical protein